MKGLVLRTKDLASLLRLLQLSGQSGMLFVRPPEENDGEAWVAQCQLDDGIVTMCRIIAKSDGRVVMSNEAALQWLMRLGTLQWLLDEKSIPQENPVPRQITQSEKTPIQSLEQSGQHPLSPWSPVSAQREGSRVERSPANPPVSQSVPTRTSRMWRGTESGVREHRQVWLLVDGQHNIEEIAQLLHKPLLVIVKILADLKSGGFIQ
jgi:hypothetical protein